MQGSLMTPSIVVWMRPWPCPPHGSHVGCKQQHGSPQPFTQVIRCAPSARPALGFRGAVLCVSRTQHELDEGLPGTDLRQDGNVLVGCLASQELEQPRQRRGGLGFAAVGAILHRRSRRRVREEAVGGGLVRAKQHSLAEWHLAKSGHAIAHSGSICMAQGGAGEPMREGWRGPHCGGAPGMKMGLRLEQRTRMRRGTCPMHLRWHSCLLQHA
jgi:hypothetical protein